MNKGLLRKLLGIFFMSSLIFSSCSPKETAHLDHSVVHPLGFFSVNEQGVVMYMDRLLRFYDFESGEKIILCNLPNCPHEPFHHTLNPDPICLAAIPHGDSFLFATIYDNQVFVFSEAKFNEMTVNRIDLDGNSRELFTTIDWAINITNDIVFKDGFAYITVQEIKFDESGASIGHQRDHAVIGLNLETGEVIQYGEVRDDDHANISSFKQMDDRLYYRHEYLDWEGEFDYSAEDAAEKREKYNRRYFYEIDIETNEERVVMDLREEDRYTFLKHFDQDYLYFLAADKTEVYTLDWELKESEVLFTGEDIDILKSLENGFVYAQHNIYDGELYYFDTESGKTITYERPDEELPINIEYGNRFFFSTKLEDDEHHLVTMNKDDYFAGKTNYTILEQ